ncbi:MAG TPA: phosphoribosyltransferase family protein [Flavobacteriales bacterium]|jgi:pyrimidine operon attenuation protein/uracil phosphoribosyltransferase
MSKEKSLILSSRHIEQKLMRMAHEIHENNYKEKEIVLVGIIGHGSSVAERLADHLRAITDIKVTLGYIEMSKDKPLSEEIKFSGELKDIKGKSVVLVDDVLNSGRTLIYAAKHLLNTEPKNLATATLIERSHRKFPIHADFVGLTLSTNMKEHVAVEMQKGKEAVYLL